MHSDIISLSAVRKMIGMMHLRAPDLWDIVILVWGGGTGHRQHRSLTYSLVAFLGHPRWEQELWVSSHLCGITAGKGRASSHSKASHGSSLDWHLQSWNRASTPAL